MRYDGMRRNDNNNEYNKRRNNNDSIRSISTTTTTSYCDRNKQQHNNKQQRQRVSSSSSLSRWWQQIGLKILMIMIGVVSLFGFFLVHHLSEVPNNTFKMNNVIMKSVPPPPPPRRRSNRQILLPLTAYIEEPLKIDKPLPIRTKPHLRKITYGTTQSCHNIPDLFPVDHPIELDPIFGPTVGTLLSLYPFRDKYATVACPVDADPFLPWIHDVFLNTDLTYVEVIASNKRRCRTDPSLFLNDMTNLEPQIAIMQSVSVKRIRVNMNKNKNSSDNNNKETTRSYRYRLALIEEADVDGRETRFICQFHTPIIIRHNNNNNNGDDVIEKEILAETLSIFPYNYEHANYQKGKGRSAKPMLTRPKDSTDIHGTHNENVWNSYNPQLLSLSSFNATEEWGTNHILPSVENSGRWSNIPICPVVVPVPPLIGNSNSGSNSSSSSTTTTTEVSSHSETDYNNSSSSSSSSAVVKTTTTSSNNNRPHHYLIGCLWTSAEFSTRGDSTNIDKSTSVRLLEWIVYHLYIAKMDHIYVYDNTPRAIITNTSNTTSSLSLSLSLKHVVELFPSDRVTRIPWKHRVCNNNRPMHKNAGERSSQYAAETSCRVRYGPTTEWLAQLDVDEYLIPAGDWTDIQSWLKESVRTGKIEKKTNILSFFQTRAVPNINFMDSCTCNKDDDPDQQSCLMKKENITFLQAYDCERTVLPKPDYGWRAKKQIYRPNYVLNHFVHYTTVTQRIHDAPHEDLPLYNQRRPYERRVNELEEAFMLHTKTTYPPATRQWTTSCTGQSEEDKKKCPVGIAYSLDDYTAEGREDLQQKRNTTTKAGFAYNCYQHKRIQNELAVKLQAFLQPFLNRFHNKY
ncbi:hypothetical protein FRACYDRAFT_235318 [Fragilariopsis cylindrus CCMP1102]|uniref:Glycosyltransferase family 92 protein n=1 Tax=Fragilariopsis cylindrus CCMP1102 TaxID=635003 RepID=A0A1E7FM68_9STRA|nr:hypothetical protein FRACYDRAFT_235318 [Fragilariopsis cylindrus CCMP1102]|eukprot:OEU19268.1 hypothetical protein FRACYDRAFT_235318 [Fragilariopsis cylindrus CCMP1102]